MYGVILVLAIWFVLDRETKKKFAIAMLDATIFIINVLLTLRLVNKKLLNWPNNNSYRPFLVWKVYVASSWLWQSLYSLRRDRSTHFMSNKGTFYCSFNSIHSGFICGYTPPTVYVSIYVSLVFSVQVRTFHWRVFELAFSGVTFSFIPKVLLERPQHICL
jgi:hypothetical protein